jgi:hypothetical protein
VCEENTSLGKEGMSFLDSSSQLVKYEKNHVPLVSLPERSDLIANETKRDDEPYISVVGVEKITHCSLLAISHENLIAVHDLKSSLPFFFLGLLACLLL